MMKQTFILLFFLLAARARSLEVECNLLSLFLSFTTHFPTIVPQMWFLQTVLTSNSGFLKTTERRIKIFSLAISMICLI